MRSVEAQTDEALKRELERIRAFKEAGVGTWSDSQRQFEIRRELVRRRINEKVAP